MLLVIGLLLLFVAPPLLLIWLVLFLSQRKEAADYRSIVATPTVPIAQARPGFVALQGRTAASDRGTVISPVSGRRVLACYVDVKAAYRKMSGSGGLEWRTVQELRERREFWLDDGSGKRAWISPHDAPAVMVQVRYGGTHSVVLGGPPETVVAMTPEVDQWARSITGIADRKLCVEESVIEEGSPLYAIGWAQDQSGVLVLCNAPSQQLMLSTLTEAQLRELINRRSTLRHALLISGCVAAVAGVLMIVIGVALAL